MDYFKENLDDILKFEKIDENRIFNSINIRKQDIKNLEIENNLLKNSFNKILNSHGNDLTNKDLMNEILKVKSTFNNDY